jgi:hypothetical protein
MAMRIHRRLHQWTLCALCSLCTVAAAHEPVAHATNRAASAASASSAVLALRLSPEPAPVAARYAVTVTAKTSAARQQVWHFYREPQRIALQKGAIDEVWHRDEQGQVSFERIFHDQQRAVDYSAGELITLGVQAPWSALATFADPRSLAALRVVSHSGAGDSERVRLAGVVGNDTLRVEWLPALQLPARLTRTDRAGTITDMRLVQHAAQAPAAWPVPGQRSSAYLRLDAADFGDMGYETVVRLSEALDVRLGWRQPHSHD